MIEYDGTDFSGFQIQKNKNSIQGELEGAIKKFTGQITRIKYAGRTDKGVHAEGQVIAFDSKVNRHLKQYIEGMNYYLPDSIAVKEANIMNEHFDPRKHALSRTYRYNIINSEKRYPLLNRSHFRVVNKLNISKINESITLFIGKHDFKQFSGPLPKGINTYREILDICVSKQQNVVQFIVKGKSFLRRQVRRMVGILVDIGLDKVSYNELKSFLDCSKKPVVYTTLPSNGLCLINVEYPNIFYKNGEII